jgi:hypothetical protein
VRLSQLLWFPSLYSISPAEQPASLRVLQPRSDFASC